MTVEQENDALQALLARVKKVVGEMGDRECTCGAEADRESAMESDCYYHDLLEIVSDKVTAKAWRERSLYEELKHLAWVFVEVSKGNSEACRQARKIWDAEGNPTEGPQSALRKQIGAIIVNLDVLRAS